ncbi:hypothetical protein SprV_0100214200 [Sparganum proliferum]
MRSSQISTVSISQRQRSIATDLPTMLANVPGNNRSYWTPSNQLRRQDDTTRCAHSTSASHPTSTIKTDRTPESTLPSSSIVSTSAAAAPVSTINAHNPDKPTNTNIIVVNTSDVGSVSTCPHYNHTFASHIGLAGHMRIHRTENGKPVPGASTYNRLRCLHRPRTFTHRVGLVGHMRVNENGIDCSLNAPSTSCTSTMPSPAYTLPPSAPTASRSTTTTATIAGTDTDTADFSCPHCPRTSVWSVTCEFIA